MSIPFPPIVELHTNLPKEAQDLIADIVEAYHNNQPCQLGIQQEGFMCDRAICVKTDEQNISFILTRDVYEYSEQIAHWVYYLTGFQAREQSIDYVVEDDGYIFIKDTKK